MIDIVYVLKDTDENEELVYSLRSVEKNLFNVRKVVFVGGKPKNLNPDYYIEVPQDQSSKWSNARKNIEVFCSDDSLTDDVILMNDDFFILKKTDATKIKNQVYGTLQEQINRIVKRSGRSRYTRRLEKTMNFFKRRGIERPLNFETHTPFIFNRHDMLKLIEMKLPIILRTGYGIASGQISEYDIIESEDKKFHSSDFKLKGDESFISSSDYSFQNGDIGKYIRKRFNKPSRFEKGNLCGNK